MANVNVDVTVVAKERTYLKAEERARLARCPLDATLRELVALVNARFDNKDSYIGSRPSYPGTVVVQPRGSFASRSALRGHVDLDLDLVIPENFKIVFEGGIELPVGKVLGEDNPFDPHAGNGKDFAGNLQITKDGLRLILLYIWGRLVTSPGVFVLPHAFTQRPLNIPAEYAISIAPGLNTNWGIQIAPGKTLEKLTRSLSAQLTGLEGRLPTTNLDLDFFAKVATTRHEGQQVIVGVDKDGPLGQRQYQTTTFIPSGKEWLGNVPLSPIDRTALLMLKWWKNTFAEQAIPKFEVTDVNFKQNGGHREGKAADIKLRSHHFLSALNALHNLPPSDPFFASDETSLPFSLVRVMDRMMKILQYLQRAYEPPQRFRIVYSHPWSPIIPNDQVLVVYPFPDDTCNTFDMLYKQASADVLEYTAIINSGVIPTLLSKLDKALVNLSPHFTPQTYTKEALM